MSRESMDVDEALEVPRGNNSGVAAAETIWKIINNPLVVILSDLQNSTAEQGIRSVLDSILRGSANLANVLVPSQAIGYKYEYLQRQYAAFSTWLFGTMFFVSVAPFCQEILSSSRQVQACMLSILAKNQLDHFRRITSEYMNVLDDLSEFDECTKNRDMLVLSRFHVERGAIKNLDLTSFPVIVSRSKIHLIQISVIEIILNVGTIFWDCTRLWCIILKMLRSSMPKVKIVSLKVVYEMVQTPDIDDDDTKEMIAMVEEIVKSVPSWRNLGLLTPEDVERVVDDLINFIETTQSSQHVLHLSFQILNLLINSSFEESEQLRNVVVKKITSHLKESRMVATRDEIVKYSAYLKEWMGSVELMVYYVLNDVKSCATTTCLDVAVVSELWDHLLKIFFDKLHSKNYPDTLIILKSSSWLDSELASIDIKSSFYGRKLNDITTLFVEDLCTSRQDDRTLIFQNIICLYRHREFRDTELGDVLMAAITDSSISKLKTAGKIFSAAESLDIAVKIQCLNVVCQFGNVEWQLPLIKELLLRNHVELAEASITSLIHTLGNVIDRVDDVVEILNLAASSSVERLRLSVVKHLGHIICLFSRRASLIRQGRADTSWTVRCKDCDEKVVCSDAAEPRDVPVGLEDFLSTRFEVLTSTPEQRCLMSENFLSLSNHTKLFNNDDVVGMWLRWIRDENTVTRLNVARAVGMVLKNRLRATLTSYDIIIGVLVSVLEKSLQMKNHDLHVTILTAAKSIVQQEIQGVEQLVLNIFLLTVLHANSNSMTVSMATAAFKEVAARSRITPKYLYHRYKRAFLEIILCRAMTACTTIIFSDRQNRNFCSQLMIDVAVRNYIDHSYNLATSLHRAAKCVGYQGSRQLLRKDANYAICVLLPYVVKYPQAKRLTADMADLITMEEKYMFIEYFQYICPYVLLNEKPRVARECLRLIENITNVGLSDLMQCSFMGIFGELMLHFHARTTDVITCLEILSRFDSEYKGMFDTREHVAAYLKPRLHGVLVNLDSNLSVRSDESVQKAALGSLAGLIRFMGPTHLTPLRYKVLGTLRTSSSFQRPGFISLICDAWDAFLHSISVEDLGPLISTIFISLISLLARCPARTYAMMEFLIITSNDSLSDYIPELFFADDPKIPEKITRAIRKHVERARPKNFEDNLTLWLKRTRHETHEIRLKALIYLQKFLADSRCHLNEMILDNSVVHPSIVELLDTLLDGCRDKDENVRLASGECLGELGAVEPSLLPRRIVSKDETKFISEMNEEFACLAITDLVRAFQSQKSTQSMDCFALAIQEILKTYGISPQGMNKPVWEQFGTTVQQMIYPFLTSHYKITSTNDDDQYPHPIYGSEAGSTFEQWSYNWICSMSRDIDDAKLKNIIVACRPAFKRDARSLTLFIPYVVSHIIANGNRKASLKIGEEMSSVFNASNRTHADDDLVHRRPLRHRFEAASNETRISDEAKRIHCSQVVFSILDHLQRWLRERRLIHDEQHRSIKWFWETFDSSALARGCYQTHEYHRSLMYLEDHMASSGQGLAQSVEAGLLAKIYAQLEEPDGISGILATQNQPPTLQQLVLAHEVGGQLQDAATCYERLAQGETLKPKYLQGMVQCYLGLDHPFTAMNITEGILKNRPELEPLIVDNECFWHLADFSQLDATAARNVMKSSILDELTLGIRPDLRATKSQLVSLLGAASHQGAYQQSYPHIMKLHILNEFEKAVNAMLTKPDDLQSIYKEWEVRGQLVRASRGVESVLGMRRATLDLAVQLQSRTGGTESDTLKQEIGKIWLKSAKIARKSRLYQQAYMYILSASEDCPPQELFIEQAQLYWQKGCQEEAFTTLKRCFANYFQPSTSYKAMPSDRCVEERRQCARAKLLYAKYNDETLNVDTDGNISNYKEAIEVWRVWEKSLLSCARYYETVVDRMSDDERDIKGRDLQVHMMNYYGKSLQYGCKYVHQSMPRMLTIWLDFASRLQASNGTTKARQDSLGKMTKLMEVYLDRLPTFLWLTAFSQLVSRICHPCREVQNTLCSVLVKLISAYPQHCLWMMASVVKSSYPARQKRCQEILNHPKLQNAEDMKLIQDFNRLWERLIELSNKPIPEGTSYTTVSALARHLPRLLTSTDFSAIMIPTTKFRQLHLPSKVQHSDNHNPFPTKWAHILGIEDRVTVMPSLQRPRRITLRGSDGVSYLFMCKPKDDLRRDFRLMEFNDVVNKYLQKDPESRQRRLYIRTYSVVPLNEECGLIEWVHNLVGFRPVLLGFYKERGILISSREIKNLICNLKDTLEKKRKVFLDVLLPRHPPVFGDWFRITFPDPYGWYEARTAYIRTMAVMSMVGYILGLGDRHGENILFDSKCGDCVHVDFNCLFNRGEFFDWPERVPFRLTHNMVEAMGPLKYEGPFRRSCQTTMRVLREQATTLVSVLTPFVYDPLVSWNKNQPDAVEKTNEKAVDNIKNIEQRLKGLLRSQGKKLENIALNLSVEGQTNHLILEATNIDNLCQMYVGWGPYL